MPSSSFVLGDLILRCEAWVWALNDVSQATHCDQCIGELRGKDPVECSECRVVRFCNEKCRAEAAHLYHARECVFLRRLSALSALRVLTNSAGETYFYTIRLLLRVLLRVAHDDTANAASDGQAPADKRQFSDLLHHWPEIRSDSASRLQHIRQLLFALRFALGQPLRADDLQAAEELYTQAGARREHDECIGEPTALSADASARVAQHLGSLDAFGQLYGRVAINSIALQTSEFGKLGGAIYLEASRFDHSCLPNAVRCFNGRQLIVRCAAQPIRCIDDVRISYVDVLQPTAVRKRELKQHYYFECQCERCVSADDERLLYGVRCQRPSQDACEGIARFHPSIYFENGRIAKLIADAPPLVDTPCSVCSKPVVGDQRQRATLLALLSARLCAEYDQHERTSVAQRTALATQMQHLVDATSTQQVLVADNWSLLELRERLATFYAVTEQFDRAHAQMLLTLPTYRRVLPTLSVELAVQLSRTALLAMRAAGVSDALHRLAVLPVALASLQIQALLYGRGSDWLRQWVEVCMRIESIVALCSKQVRGRSAVLALVARMEQQRRGKRADVEVQVRRQLDALFGEL